MISMVITDINLAHDVVRKGVGDKERKKEIDWLKSLKDKVIPQPKQEWSEKDEENLNNLAWLINLQDDMDDTTKKDYVSWLKSLRPQNRWKPNGDQIDALYDMIRSFKKESSYSNRDDIANIVEALFEQLKAL